MITHTFLQIFRVTQNGKHWKPLNSNVTLERYAQPLHALAQAVLLTLDGHHSGYSFPIAPSTTLIGRKLKIELNKAEDDDTKLVALFHSFVFPFLSARTLVGEFNKWDDVLECFLAIQTLKSDGNWEVAAGITQLFAMLKYLCRGAMLYQASLTVGQFKGDLYK